MKLLNQAAHLNRQGAAFLSLENYDAAFNVLIEAATILQTIVVDEQHDDDAHRSLATCVSSSMGPEIPALQSSDFHIFGNAMLFEVEQRCPDDSLLTGDQQRFCVSVIMFNMAAGRHAQAIRLGKDGYLEKAFSL